jgi:four helix bundle protein
MSEKIRSHHELDVYRTTFSVAMEIFELSKRFPKEETYSLTDQIRRSSRSVCANLAEAWRKRRYEAAFIAKLSDAEAEVAETEVWLEFAVKCAYVDREQAKPLYETYDRALSTIVGMINHPRNLDYRRRSIGLLPPCHLVTLSEFPRVARASACFPITASTRMQIPVAASPAPSSHQLSAVSKSSFSALAAARATRPMRGIRPSIVPKT